MGPNLRPIAGKFLVNGCMPFHTQLLRKRNVQTLQQTECRESSITNQRVTLSRLSASPLSNPSLRFTSTIPSRRMANGSDEIGNRQILATDSCSMSDGKTIKLDQQKRLELIWFIKQRGFPLIRRSCLTCKFKRHSRIQTSIAPKVAALIQLDADPLRGGDKPHGSPALRVESVKRPPGYHVANI